MKKHANKAIFTVIVIAFFAVTSCSDSESKYGSLLGNNTQVIISLGLPQHHAAAEASIIDRILRFFTRDAVAQSAPAAFSSINVRVTGADIGVIENQFSPYGMISFNVPSGALRQFEVTAFVDASDPSGAASFRGTTSANLPAGQTVSIPVVMRLFETKIIIPDYNNNVIIKIDTMSGAGWTTYDGPAIHPAVSSIFYPHDVDFDSYGRIYITNADPGGNVSVVRMSSLNSPPADNIAIGTSGARSISIDRVRNKVYYVNMSDEIIACGYEGQFPVTLNTAGLLISSINGIDVDQGTGNLYINCDLNSTIPSTVLLDVSGINGEITTPVVLQSFTLVSLGRDIAVRPPYVYVLSGGGMLRIPMDLDAAATLPPPLYGNPANVSDTFYGPARFVGLTPGSLTIIDDGIDFGDPYPNRLVRVNDIYGTGWLSFVPRDHGILYDFSFYMTGG
jgi:hypothetical protein